MEGKRMPTKEKPRLTRLDIADVAKPLKVRLLSPGANTIAVASGYRGCLVVSGDTTPSKPPAQDGENAYRIAAYIDGILGPNASIAISLPAGADSYAVDLPLGLAMTPDWMIENALADSGQPSPPVVVT